MVDLEGTRAHGVEFIDGLFSYAMILTGNQAVAERSVEAVFSFAIEGSNEFQSAAQLKLHLFTVLRRLCLERVKGLWAESSIEGDDSDDNSDALLLGRSHHSTDSEEITSIRAAFLKLHPLFRELVFLREYEKFSYREMSFILGCPTDTVMTRLRAARSILMSIYTGLRA